MVYAPKPAKQMNSVVQQLVGSLFGRQCARCGVLGASCTESVAAKLTAQQERRSTKGINQIPPGPGIWCQV